MIRGRPVNQWLGVVTSGAGVVSVILLSMGLDPVLVAQLLASLVAFLGAIITLVAGQAPTLSTGDRYLIETPKGQPNYEATVMPPPMATQPVPVPDEAGPG